MGLFSSVYAKPADDTLLRYSLKQFYAH